jgi:acetate kinase
MRVLVLNSGSSSQKTCLYEIGGSLPEHPPPPVWQGKIEWENNQARLNVRNASGAHFEENSAAGSRRQAIERLLDTLWQGGARALSAPSEIDVVGHRVVHGGQEYEQPTIVSPEVKAAIARLTAFAPLHNGAELEGIEIIEQRLGKVPQVAAFDTAFHRTMAPSMATYPGPYEWLAQGIRRYGFHGINHQYCAERASQLLGRELQSLRIVSCHLGNGCSLSAIQGGRSVETTMGFTPLEGLMMGTRSGSVDPGIVTYLIRQGHLTAAQVDELLNSKSGLLGISGISGDMRKIVSAMKAGDQRAQLAFDMFVHRLRTGIGAMVASLGGIDVLAFTAGIGENSAEVRSAALANTDYLGIRLDPDRNLQPPSDGDIACKDSVVRVLVIHAEEDWAIARDCWRLVAENRARSTNSAS